MAKSIKVDTLIFGGIDTAVSVEWSLRDGFNRGYDVIFISDATASISKKKYESTLDNVKGYYGLWPQLKKQAICKNNKTLMK